MTAVRKSDPAKAHGLNGYTNRGCRCTVCRKAQADYCFERTAERRELVETGAVSLSVHNRNTYTNWGCRCRICKDDRNRYYGNLRAGRKAAS